jgi:uncharacterized membrane protein YdjX (TVP38/TMEM64 family)
MGTDSPVDDSEKGKDGVIEARSDRPLIRLLVLLLFALGVAAFFLSGLGRFITLASLKENRETLLRYTDAHYLSVVILFILIFALQSSLSIPGTVILSIAGGALFGSVLGTLYVNIGATIGATGAFLTARYLFRDLLERKYGRRIDSIQRGFAGNAFRYLLTLRLIAIFPFFLVNLASGLTRIPLRTYVAATSLGILPVTFVVTNAGKHLGNLNSPGDILSPEITGAFVLLGLLGLAPVVYRRFRKTPEAK